MAEGAEPKNSEPNKNVSASQQAQIQIMPKPKPLQVDLNKEKKPAVKKPESNVFTQLFGDDKVMQSSNLMDPIKKQVAGRKLSSFKKKLNLESIKKSQKNKKSKVSNGKIMLRVSIMLFALSGSFFYTQNKAEFGILGANPAQERLVALNQLTEVEAEVLVQKHLSAILLLDQFAGKSDSYLYNLRQAASDVNSSNKKEAFASAAQADKDEIINLLQSIQKKVDSSISQDQKVAANILITNLIDALEAKAGTVDESTLTQDLQDLQNTRSLILNDSFRSDLIALNPEDANEDAIASLMEGYNNLNRSVYALISSIRNNRMEWSKYFSEIESLTKKVDPLFNTEFPGNLILRDIRFEGYKISISGFTVTDDSKNFTLVSNYIDLLESSSSFMNVEDRSYSKNKSEEEYEGQFRISLELQNE